MVVKKGGFLKRKTPLKSKTGFKTRTPLKRAKLPLGATKRRKTTSDLSKLKKKLWELCRALQIKAYGATCYTCGKTGLEGSNLHLGHFIPSSVCSVQLRYSLDNLRPQCYRCNIHLSGNWIAYEENLKREKGDDFVAYLKDTNQKTKGLQYDTLWYQNKINEYANT